MKKSFLLVSTFAIATSLITVSCGPSNEDLKDLVDNLEEMQDELEEETLFTSEDGNFTINFFGNEPAEASNMVPTEAGTIEMFTFMYEKSATEVYMVAYADYPSELTVDSDPMTLLRGAESGALGNLGIFSAEQEEEIEIDGHPGLFFTGNNGQYYVTYEVYMVNNRLYQVAILRDGSYAEKENVETFMDSFAINSGDSDEEADTADAE